MTGPKPPHSVDAEREVLAAVFIDPEAIDLVLESLHADDFYVERHRLVFQAMQATHKAGSAVDLVTLMEAMKTSGTLDRAGGIQTLSTILDRIGTVTNVEHYARIVRDRAQVRRMIDVGRSIVSEGLQSPDVTDYLDASERAVFEVMSRTSSSSARPMSELVGTSLERIQRAYESGSDVTGVGSGFGDLDRLTHGWQPGELTILGARPSMGKSALAGQLAVAEARRGGTVAVFSLEMPGEQWSNRVLAAEARIDLSRLSAGIIADDEWTSLTAATAVMERMPIIVDDDAMMTPSRMRARCRRIARRHGLSLVIVDYLQLMSGDTRKGSGSREQEIAYISRSLKGLAKDLKCPVIALSQLNRGLESRADKRPMLSDLRESGSIEQDADLVCFIYREEVYTRDVPPEQQGVAELIVAKNRNGPCATVRLKFWSSWTRFDSLYQGGGGHGG